MWVIVASVRRRNTRAEAERGRVTDARAGRERADETVTRLGNWGVEKPFARSMVMAMGVSCVTTDG